MPEPEPSSLTLVGDALLDAVHAPDRAQPCRAHRATRPARRHRTADRRGQRRARHGADVPASRTDRSPLRAEPGEQRRVAIARTRLADYRAVREPLRRDGERCGACGRLRRAARLVARPGRAAATRRPPVRALVPVSSRRAGSRPRPTGQCRLRACAVPTEPRWYRHPAPGGVQPLLIDLPVGEADPLVRLAQLQVRDGHHPPRVRAGGRRRPAGGPGRVRPANAARPRGTRRQPAGASPVQSDDHQRARAAGAASTPRGRG